MSLFAFPSAISLSPIEKRTERAVILIKASPQVGQKYGETVCCAGVTPEGTWVRLYPINFRQLRKDQKFGRWDIIEYECSASPNDDRVESRRVQQETIKIVGKLKTEKEKNGLLHPLEVKSLRKTLEKGLSLAIIRPINPQFTYEKKTPEVIAEQTRKFAAVIQQMDLFGQKPGIPYQTCPYAFKLHFESEDGEHNFTFQDWETDAMYYYWSKDYGEKKALELISQKLGIEYPQKGAVLSMGTHSRYHETWLLNGIVRLNPPT